MPSKLAIRIGAAVAILLALVPLIPGSVDSYLFTFLFFVFVYAILAQGWNLVAGFAGQISLGHHAFFAIGAYATAIIWRDNLIWGPLYENHPYIYYFDPITMFLSGLIAAVAAAIIGLPLLSKLRGDYFALGTLGFGEILRVIFINGGDFTGGALGVIAPSSAFDTLRPHYLVGLALTVGFAVAIGYLMKSRFGLALIAVRDDEMAASANGVNILMTKTMAFAGSGFIAGVAGSLFAFYLFHVGPASVLILDWTLLPLMMTVVGGTGTILGPIVGTFIMYAVFDFARVYVPDYHPVISGLTIILAMLFLPSGVIRIKWSALDPRAIQWRALPDLLRNSLGETLNRFLKAREK